MKLKTTVATDLLADLVTALSSSDALVVAPSSGSGGPASDACGFVPQSLPRVLVAAPLEVFRDRVSNTLVSRPWPDAAGGPCIDVWAPGVEIEGPLAGNDDRNLVLSGPVQAAALLAGAAARIIGSVKAPMNDFDSVRRDVLTGCGDLNNVSNVSTKRVLYAPVGTTQCALTV